MKRTSRGTVASLALACAAALLGTGTASAAEYPYSVTDPSSQPGGCTTAGELAWVGNTDVMLTAKVQGESSTEGLPQAHFRLWREGAPETPVVDTTVGTSGGSTVTLPVLKTSLPPEGPYWWQVRLESASGASEWTTACGFSTDHTRPAAPAVAFLDATPYPNASDPGTVRTVRIALPEGTEASYFCVDPLSRDVTLSCPAEKRVPVGADGTATTTFVTPERTGPATAWARAFDRAGNPSDAAGADYWVKTPFVEPFGDFDSDGRADLLGVDAEGRLTRGAGLEGGGFAAPVVADGRDWTGAVVARAGYLINRFGPQEPNDVRNDLVARQGAKLLVYPGDGAGGFGAPAEITGYDWSNVTAISLGRAPEGVLPRLVVVEGDRLLVFDLYEGGTELRVSEPVVLASSGWAGRTIAASDAYFGWFAAGVLARDPERGSLEFAGVDYGLDTAPYVLVPPVTVADSDWTARQVPSLVAAGDLTGDELTDLVTADRRGGLTLHPGREDGTLGTPVPLSGTGFKGLRLF
ncbi:hypothetical protein [Streptomyces sp. NPDC048623]|uniref:hypothetical protein n=1 Tax=Streptomyces sp. NPDC048623 TaxID=3155761 RepID=UPI0034186CA7